MKDLLNLLKAQGQQEEFDGIRILVPQMGHLSDIEGAELDFSGSRLVANSAGSA